MFCFDFSNAGTNSNDRNFEITTNSETLTGFQAQLNMPNPATKINNLKVFLISFDPNILSSNK